jgi:predicted Ser/Thr protein kinase
MSILDRKHSVAQVEEEMSLQEYLERCKKDPMAYATPGERMLKSIGEPEMVDTRDDPRLSRIFSNRVIKVYPAFAEFYGMEDAIESIVAYFRHSAQGMEEKKQVLYLLGPVGGGKSSLAERLKKLAEKIPFYAIKGSPINENPLGLFEAEDLPTLEAEYGIPSRYAKGLVMSPWAVKRLKEFEGDITKFRVVKMYPSILAQKGISKTEPGDENNQDISSLVGKVDIRQLEKYSQDDPDCYSYSGGLCLANRGLLEFVEMFKAPIKVLHPLLTATQEQNYKGTEGFGAIPFDGIVLAHCFSEDTELLTEGGWKKRHEVEVGDLVATLNRSTGMVEYQPALNKFEQYYEGPMHHMSSSAADHLVTPNHKMIYESYGNYKECLASEFHIVGGYVPVSGKVQRKDSTLYQSDDELRLHIWCVTDGSVHYIRQDGTMNYRFHFRKERKIKALSELLTRMGLDWKITEGQDGLTNMYVYALPAKYTKQLTEAHRLLSPRQTSILLETWSITDGNCPSKNSRDNHFQLATNVPFHKDLIQELAAISGHKTTCSINHKEGCEDVYMLHIRLEVERVRSDGINKGTVDYSGMVWCLETANHTLVSRRNGKVLITGNSNESEWQTFKQNRNNEAFLDRIYIVKVPYSLRVSDEVKIYEKLVQNSSLAKAPCAPGTLEMMAQLSILSRLKEPENSSIFSKMRVYDGENLKEVDPRAKSHQEYVDFAGVDEGMSGLSTRFAFKIISRVFNFPIDEVSANPIHLMYVLEQQIEQEQFAPETEQRYLRFIKEYLAPKYAEFIGKELQMAYLDSYGEFGQNIFDRYVTYADFWLQDQEFRDPDTGEMLSKSALDEELSKIEKPAGISNPKDFRGEIVNFCLRARANNKGKNPDWKSYEKLRLVIEKKMFSSTEDLLPVLSFSVKGSKADQKKQDDFIKRMEEKGYTKRQIRLLADWYLRVKKNS